MRGCEIVSKVVRVLFAIGEAIGSSFGTRVARLMFRFFVFICFACHHHKFLSPSWQFQLAILHNTLPKNRTTKRRCQSSVASCHSLLSSFSCINEYTHTLDSNSMCLYRSLSLCLFFDSVMTFRPFFLQVLLF